MAILADLGFDKNCKQVVDDIVKVYNQIDILACFEAHEGREFHYKHNISECILDYTATKGAVVAFTKGLSLQLVNKGVRVNGVTPGSIWTPLIPVSFEKEETA
ncbi:hypothetical protein J1N35_023383 [Gossypium stocksii]|uniref:Uncharacterized protein n=1 Tax=Gossypium stocksii TaxID=47602 RepID=A0A9D3VJY4_9ROSI|nr:hypothetical protein J1N35_023383 [Gossypium stocksii]